MPEFKFVGVQRRLRALVCGSLLGLLVAGSDPWAARAEAARASLSGGR